MQDVDSTVASPQEPEELPLPVPDVPGADATRRGLPRRIDLTLRQRLIVDSSALADVAAKATRAAAPLAPVWT